MARNSGRLLWPPSLIEVDRRGLEGDAFEIERDAHAVGGRRAEIRIKLHASSAVSSWPSVSATSCAERSVILLQRAIERVAVARRQDFGEPAREVERMRRQFLVHRAARRGEREKRLAHVGAVGAARQKLAPFQDRHRARHFGLVHVGVGADRFAGHHAVLAERDQHPPFRHADPIAPRIDPRQGLRHQARHDIELIRQKFFELQRRVVGFGRGVRLVPNVALYRRLPDHGGNMAEVARPRNGIREWRATAPKTVRPLCRVSRWC